MEDYTDVRNYGFHCSDDDHAKAFHRIVGPASMWSCSCKELDDLGKSGDRQCEVDWDDSDEGGSGLVFLFSQILK